METDQLQNHTLALLGGLHREFDGQFTPEHIEAIGRANFERLIVGARVLDFIPVLVYRATRNNLIDIRTDRLHDAA